MEDRIWVGVEESELDQAPDTVCVALVAEGSPQDGVGRVDPVQLGVDGAVSVGVS